MPLVETQRGNKVVETINFVLEECCRCGIPFMMPSYFKRRKTDNPGEGFYCPNGHSMVYTGKTEAQKLQEQLDRERSQRREEERRLTDELLDVMNEKTKIERKLQRVHNGVCPCCKRTFKNLQRHMKSKHPEVTK